MCLFPLCTRHPEKNGWCIFHQRHSSSVEVNIKEEIPKVSEKEKKKKVPRKKQYELFLAANPKCKAKFSKQCLKKATTVHHLKGRTPDIVDNQDYWLPCCHICNNEIEARHADAESQGLKIPQHRKNYSIKYKAHNMKHICGITPENIISLEKDQVFVFGSNLAGHHAGGAAYAAIKWGAELGNGEGLRGNTYALPTKDENIETLDIFRIATAVTKLKTTITDYPKKYFLITKVGCGLAGLDPQDVAPLFDSFIDITNCSLPLEFINIITQTK